MKIDERFTPRSRMLLFSTLELLRKEIRLRFSDWKDADDWLFAQLDFTKDELAQIYKGRDVLYHDASAVDFAAAKKERENALEFVYDFGDGYKVAKVYAEADAEMGYGDIFATKQDFDQFAGTDQYVEGYCVIDMDSLLIPDSCAGFCDTVTEAIEDYKIFKVTEAEKAVRTANHAFLNASIPLSEISFIPAEEKDGKSLKDLLSSAEQRNAKISTKEQEPDR